MKKYNIKDKLKVSGWSSWEMTLLDNRRILRPLSACRSFVCDNLFKLKFPKYKGEAPIPYNYKKGFIYVLVHIERKTDIDNMIANIHKLHEKEDIAKIRHSVLYSTDNPNMFVIEGSKYWKDSCWKLMLYTFYIKCLSYDNMQDCDKHYWVPLLKNNNETTLLKKIRDQGEFISKEVYGENLDTGIHNKEGFVSICSGLNMPMANHLGVKV